MGILIRRQLGTMTSARHCSRTTAGGDWSARPAGDALTLWAPAKLNLFLEVRARRPDGYHDLETLMVAVSLYDRLTFRAADGLSLACNDPALTTGPDNLILKAAELLRRRTGCRLGAAVELRKRIPLDAGLAGGSTDAACALAGLNHLWRLGLGRDELSALGAELGSDVSFFFHTPAAWCTGRGERVAPLALTSPLYFVIVRPPVGLSTRAVFGALAVPTAPEDGSAVRAALSRGNAQELGPLLFNRLEGPAFALSPAVAETAAAVKAAGAPGGLMSGSGSCVFALCRDRRDAVRTHGRFRRRFAAREGFRLFSVRTCT